MLESIEPKIRCQGPRLINDFTTSCETENTDSLLPMMRIREARPDFSDRSRIDTCEERVLNCLKILAEVFP